MRRWQLISWMFGVDVSSLFTARITVRGPTSNTVSPIHDFKRLAWFPANFDQYVLLNSKGLSCG